jgi:hypothetical protein
MVLNAQALRDEFEEGVKEAKERAKEEKERVKAIREQWEVTKKTNNPVRVLFFGSDSQIEMRACTWQDKAARTEYKRSLERSRAGATCYAPCVCPTLCATGHRPRGPHILCAHTQRGRARGGSGAPGWRYDQRRQSTRPRGRQRRRTQRIATLGVVHLRLGKEACRRIRPRGRGRR